MEKVDKSAMYKERLNYKKHKKNEEARYNRARKFKIDYKNLDASLCSVEWQIRYNLIPRVIQEWMKVRDKIFSAIEKEKYG